MPKRDTAGVPTRISEDVAIWGCENWILIDDETVDALANGVCPEALAERMWRLKSLEREGERQVARRKAVV